MRRKIKYIVVHCTGTTPDATIDSILKFWKEVRKWNNPGYHYLIKRNGEIVSLLSEDKIANGVKDFNIECVHVAYIGGVDKAGNRTDNRTPAQIRSLFNKLVALSEKYPGATILGHRDFKGVTKKCPSFDVREWLRNYTPDELAIAA
ncbi:N-acetylmuramoyl-L-alanine amidase [Longitalea luteola]|uniref:N-acetylmuramoyl-L-alanine amidase n=1 Tax=Longitalea luteola TaxID=2812563 RepID=UPI001A96AAC8|nr:N-acetylmuramoyl-L-alanine amidase [Longitalea luteola]